MKERIEQLEKESKTLVDKITEEQRQINVSKSEIDFAKKSLKLINEQIEYLKGQLAKLNSVESAENATSSPDGYKE